MALIAIPARRASEPPPTTTHRPGRPNGFSAAIKFIPSRNGHAAYRAPEIFTIEDLAYPVIRPEPKRIKTTRPEHSLTLSEKKPNIGNGHFSPYLPERFKLIKMVFRAPRTFPGSTHELDRAAENRLIAMATEQLPNVYIRVITKVNNTIPIGFDSFRSSEEHAMLAKRFPLEKKIKLGSGSYGKVYLVEDAHTKGMVAIKINRSNKIKHALDELVKTARVQSIPHVLPLEHFFQIAPSKYALVFKLFKRNLHDSMEARVSQKLFYSLDHIESFCRKFLETFAELHRLGIMYCDTKENNACASATTGEFYLYDFGRSTVPKREGNIWKYIPNIAYQAPEVTLEADYSYPAEIYSLGCVFFRLLTNMHLFQQVTNKPKKTLNGRVLEGSLAKAGRHLFEVIDIFGNTIPDSVIARGKLREHFFTIEDGKPKFLIKIANKIPLISRLYEAVQLQRRDASPERFKMACDLMLSMLDPDPLKRPTAKAALNHPFLHSSQTPEPLSSTKKDIRSSSSLSESDGFSRSLASSRGLPPDHPTHTEEDEILQFTRELQREFNKGKPERKEQKHPLQTHRSAFSKPVNPKKG